MNSANSVIALREATITLFRSLGWQAAYFVFPVNAERGPKRLMTNIGFPDEWEKAYRAGLHRFDPLPDIARKLAHPFSWTHLPASLSLTSEELGYLASLSDWGMSAGVGVPTYGPRGRVGYVGIGLPESEDLAEAPDFARLRIAAESSFLRYCDITLGETPSTIPLSGRERDVLQLIARGLQKAEIADALSISKNTVDTYFRRIYSKLEVSDRAAAVTIGLSQGLIATEETVITEDMLRRQPKP